MSIAEKYFKEQMKSGEFRRAYLEEKDKARHRVPSGRAEEGYSEAEEHGMSLSRRWRTWRSS